MTIYLIGAISGSVAGIVAACFVAMGTKKSEGIKFGKFSKGEQKIYPIAVFLFFTFLFGPALSFFYTLKLERHTKLYAMVDQGLQGTFSMVMFFCILLLLHQKVEKYSLFLASVFVFAIYWFMPFLFILFGE